MTLCDRGSNPRVVMSMYKLETPSLPFFGVSVRWRWRMFAGNIIVWRAGQRSCSAISDPTALGLQSRWLLTSSPPSADTPFFSGLCSRSLSASRLARPLDTFAPVILAAFHLSYVCKTGQLPVTGQKRVTTYCTSVNMIAFGTMSIIVLLVMLK